MEGELSNFTDDLNDKLMKLGQDLTRFLLEYVEDMIFKLKEIKEEPRLIIVYEIISEEMEERIRIRKEKLLKYILNIKKGITNLYKHQKELHGCSAEGHISHLYSARLSSRPLGWKVINVNNISKLRLIKEKL